MNPGDFVTFIVTCFGAGVGIQVFAQLVRRGRQ